MSWVTPFTVQVQNTVMGQNILPQKTGGLYIDWHSMKRRPLLLAIITLSTALSPWSADRSEGEAMPLCEAESTQHLVRGQPDPCGRPLPTFHPRPTGPSWR
jgi:hypothetical protein